MIVCSLLGGVTYQTIPVMKFNYVNYCAHLVRHLIEPMKISHSIMINSDMTWNVYVHGNKVLCRRNTLLSQFSDRLSAESLQSLISIVDSASVCPGNPDEKFIRMVKAKNGVVKSANGEKKAAVDDAFQVSLNGEIYQQTIRTTNCSLLVHGTKCQVCTDYWSHLRAMYNRWSRNKGKVSKFSNNRYMNTPQKQRKMKSLQAHAYTAEQEIKKVTRIYQIVYRKEWSAC